MTGITSILQNYLVRLRAHPSGLPHPKQERIKQNILQALPFWVASLLTGLLAVGYAMLFAMTEKYMLSLIHLSRWYLFILSPTCFLISWWLVKKFAPAANGSGIPQVIAAIRFANPRQQNLVNILLNIKIIFIKILSSLFMVFGGGAVGREGPTIQLAGSVFWSVNKILPRTWAKISKRNIIVAGAAAGLAAAFNTPLGGIVFAVEELASNHLSYFRTAIFTAVIIAGLTAQSILGPYLYLGYPKVDHLSNFVVFYVILVAVVAGFCGKGLSMMILKVIELKRTYLPAKYLPYYILFIGLVTAAIAFFLGNTVLGSGKELMQNVLFGANKYVGFRACLLRIIGPVLSYSVGGAGGVFAPALSAGAAVGSVVAQISNLVGANANMLILAGMVAFLTGVTQSPFTSAILVLEMTDQHNLIIYLMLAGMISGLISSLLDKRSFYTHLEHIIIHDIEEDQKSDDQK